MDNIFPMTVHHHREQLLHKFGRPPFMNFSGFLELLKKAASLGIFRDDVEIL